MMRRGRQAADDGSFVRSVGVHTARGALLIGLAVILGVVLLQKVDTGKGSAAKVSNETPTSLVVTLPPTSTTTTRPPSQVRVLIANGTTTGGMGGAAQRLITPAGYNVLAPVDATVAAKAARRNTLVYYAAGYDSDARKIATLLALNPPAPTNPLPATGLPVTDIKGANVVVLIGPDYISQKGAPGATTTTTRRL